MSDKLRESVSALMDGEADQLELRRLLSDENREAVDDIWSNYHLARDAMQGNMQSSAFKHLDISAQVSAATQEMMAVTDEDLAASEAKEPWWRPAAGFAVAASVTMAVVLGVQSLNPAVAPAMDAADSVQPLTLAAAPAPASATSGRVFPFTGGGVQVAASTAQPAPAVNYRMTGLPVERALNPVADQALQQNRAAADLEIRKKLNSYMLRHTEQAALNNGQGMISFARVASFESEE